MTNLKDIIHYTEFNCTTHIIMLQIFVCIFFIACHTLINLVELIMLMNVFVLFTFSFLCLVFHGFKRCGSCMTLLSQQYFMPIQHNMTRTSRIKCDFIAAI